ncbi:hypothetical protein H5410_025243 [Solanum commersonii]|uniref:Uncharacterized protein n=1 Tax=Solanum commersonii TaxID=4109 RepID=A0A9J5YVF7_SOLCO|nr:hypothetical protein H5410_025243 [Solanum commersonii]
MVRSILLPRINGDNLCTSMPLAIGLFFSIIAIVALCAKHAKKSKTNIISESKIVPKFSSPQQLSPNMTKKGGEFSDEVSGEVAGDKKGLWQKTIIMGEKCKPPQFSGVIYYDCSGNRDYTKYDGSKN